MVDTNMMIHADQNVTRRKWYHIVTDEQETVLFASRRIGECLSHIHEAGQDRLSLKLPDGTVWSMERLGKPRKDP